MNHTEQRQAVFPGPSWPEHYTFVPALRIGDMVWISGTTGTDATGQITAPNDVVEQTRQIFQKFDALLRSLGGTCRDIVSTTDFITSVEHYKETATIRREFFKDCRPTSTGVIVAGLLRKDALIEISAIAVLTSRPAASNSVQPIG